LLTVPTNCLWLALLASVLISVRERGADGWVGIEEFGKAKEGWFKELLQLPNGIPSHDTFGRVFASIDPNQFEASFHQWVQGISGRIQGVIAIDGKTSRRTHDRAAGKKALHRVSAWAVENRLVLAQVARRVRNRMKSPPFHCSCSS
jgi:DDE_Tnp_1-associated